MTPMMNPYSKSNSEENDREDGAKFINNQKNKQDMEAGRSIPLLCVDSSAESKKAKKKLSTSRKDFEIRIVTKTEKISLKPPVLFTIHGVFRGYQAIEAYAGSRLPQAI
jgi:hypothetical protein